jgi:O-antigen/teichoic acid export membrane protein
VWLDAQIQTLGGLLRAYGFIKDQSTLVLVARLANLAGTIGFAYLFTPTASAALWGIVAASVMVLALQIGWGLYRNTPVVGVDWDWSIVKDLMVYGIPRIPSGFLLNMILSVDTFFVGSLISITDAGYYGVATTLLGIAAGSIAPIGTVAFPLFSELIGREARYEVKRYLTSLLSFALYVGFFVASVTAVLARPIVLVLYTQAFSPAITPLAVVMIGAFFYALYIALRGFVAAYTVKPVLVYFLGLGLAVNIALNGVLIPPFGATGAALATSSAYAVLGCLTLFYTWRVHPFDWLDLQIGRLPFAVLPPVILAFLLRPFLTNLPALIIGGGIIVLTFGGMLWKLDVEWFVVAQELALARLARPQHSKTKGEPQA